MLKSRVIPTLLWHNDMLVKGKQFRHPRRVGTLLPAIKVYNMRHVDELIILDTTATVENREPAYSVIEEAAANCFVPMAVGGGISKIEHIKNLLSVGADKVVICSAFSDESFMRQAIEKFGSQCIVDAFDVSNEGSYICRTHAGSKESSLLIDNLNKCNELGVGEIIITDIASDGMLLGYNLDLLSFAVEHTKIPIVCSGGAGEPSHCAEALSIGAHAVAAASMFHFTEYTPRDIKNCLQEHGFCVRL